MKIVTSFLLLCFACTLGWGQSGFTAGIGVIEGVTIRLQSKAEPERPEVPYGSLKMGTKFLGAGKPDGMARYTANEKTHEYFGYDMRIVPTNVHTGTYRVTFSALTLKPEELGLASPASWRMLPAPDFPPPALVTTLDTIALDLFVNPVTKQKIVDYIRLEREDCDAENATLDQDACIEVLVENERHRLLDTLSQVESGKSTAVAAAIKTSQQSWETYVNDACDSLETETKRLQCRLKLTRSRIDDIRHTY